MGERISEGMKIAFIHDWEPDIEQALTWKDGLAAAIKIIGETDEIRYFTVGKRDMIASHEYFDMYFHESGDSLLNAVRDYQPDVILHWADMTRPHAEGLKKLGKPMAICFAGGQPFGPNWHLFDHIFVESNSYLMQFQQRGLGPDQVSTAFGTNEKLFTPVENQRKNFDVIFPATYCDWKRHNLLVDAMSGTDLKVITSGFMYEDHETHCWQAPQRAGFTVLPHVSAATLRHMFAASRVCVIPSHWTGGSQRTVLEAMAMNVPVIAMTDSDKTSEYLMDAELGKVVSPTPEDIRTAVLETLDEEPINSRDYILSKWTAKHYADAIMAGLKKIV